MKLYTKIIIFEYTKTNTFKIAVKTNFLFYLLLIMITILITLLMMIAIFMAV